MARTIAVILFPFCMLVPFLLVWAYAGFKRMVEVWPAILVASGVYSLVQFLMATYFGPSLAAIVAAISTIVALIVFLRFWKPKRVFSVKGEYVTDGSRLRFEHSTAKIFKAWMPWLVLSAWWVFAWGFPPALALDGRQYHAQIPA